MDVFDWARAIAALAMTLALVAAAAYAARRLGMAQNALAGGPRRLRVVERLMIDPRRSVVIVSIDGRDRALLLSPFGDVDLAHTESQPASAVQDPGVSP